MLSFFPNPYPDEVLYSVFARYQIRSGNLSPKATLRELFGNEHATAIVDLPCNLDSLVNNLSEFGTYSMEDFIYKNTFFPLFAPFIPEDRAELILNSMKSSNGGDISTRAGIMASSIQNPKYLRFCYKCFTEDKEKYGEPYWHRVHQVAGVMLCPKHGEFLMDSSVPWHGLNKHEYIAASEENCKVKMPEIPYNNKEINIFSSVGKSVVWILDSKLKSRDINWFEPRYLKILIEKGYSSPKGRIYQEQLLSDFTQYYGSRVLTALQSKINLHQNSIWLSSMVRKARKVFHPIRHILLLEFLGTNIKEFLQECQIYTPFGKGPWPCLNSASDHYHKNVIVDMTIVYDAKIKQPVGNFICNNCGFAYSRRGPDKTEADRYRIGRIKEFGPAWMQKLKELHSIKDLSMREIARQLNVDTNTVIKYINNDFQNTHSKESEVKEHEFNILKEDYRNKWLQLIAANMNLTKTELRHIDELTYMWLFRNDKHWLNNIKYKEVNNYKNNRVDWEQRDNELLLDIKKLISQLVNTNAKPERITISRIGRTLGKQALFEKHINKLPNAKEYLSSVVESVEDFQIRRIKWAAVELNNKGKILEKWMILRKAAIRSNCSERILNAINNEILVYGHCRKVE